MNGDPEQSRLDERRLTAEDAAALYGVPTERFLIWWLRGEVPFRRIKEFGRSYFVLDDATRTLSPESARQTERRWHRLHNWLRRTGVLDVAK